MPRLCACTCRHREMRCTCSADVGKAQVWDAAAGKRITRSFATITRRRRWRQDAATRRCALGHADRRPRPDARRSRRRAGSRPPHAGSFATAPGDTYKPSALRGYRQNLDRRVLPELGRDRLRELTLPQLQRFVDGLAADGLAPATITTTITPLRAIYRRARQLGEVQANPTSGLSPSRPIDRRQTRFATAEQVEALLVAARRREGPAVVGHRPLRRPPSRRAHRAAPRGGGPRHRGDPRRARLGRLRGRGRPEVEAGPPQGPGACRGCATGWPSS